MCEAPPPPLDTGRTRRVAALLCFVSVASFAATLPFSQAQRDALGCGALCQGAMTSSRNALSLVGAPLVGRLSDAKGRRWAVALGIAATLASGLLTATATSLPSLWVALAPAALLSHQFDALKAALADACRVQAEGAQGVLGMSAGLGFGGVALGAVVTSPRAVVACAGVGAVLSAALCAALPRTRPQHRSPGLSLRLPSARTPKGALLLSLRALMGAAFHVFAALWQESLKQRQLGAADHARFMSFVGLGYAASQGLVAPRILKTASRVDRVLVACCACLSLGRVAAFAAPSLPLVYLAYAPVVLALGVLNAALAAAVASVAPQHERGGFFGLLSAVEAICGMIFPAAGGLLAVVTSPPAVCALVCLCYLLAALLIHRHWQLLNNNNKKSD